MNTLARPAPALDKKNILFAALDLPVIDKGQAIKWLKTVPESHWFFDSYRNCKMLSLMTKNGGITRQDTEHRQREKEFLWARHTPDFIRKYFEDYVFSWTKMRSRIIIIKTPPGGQNSIHIDCSPQTFSQVQHKFRIVIQGYSNSLYFETRQGKKHAPRTEKPFIMDGSWPHGMINNSPLCKYTICFGSPWSSSDSCPSLKNIMLSHKRDLPKNYKQYFHPKYQKDC